MRILGESGLVLLTPAEWLFALAALTKLGYQIRRAGQGNPPTLWAPDGCKCVGDYNKMERKGYLDETILIDLLENAA